ncbi:MAG TPA: RNA methyltransferase [Solirubrobacteraceae bacterium]|nr:RNA methyltransferase [Solirubrobacteraceae bacterium]
MTAPSPRDTFITIYGRKPVLEALADASVDIDKVLLASGAREASAQAILDAAERRSVRVERLPAERITRISRNGRHDQGVVADVRAPRMRTLPEWLAELGDRAPAQLFVLDGVTNPANVGMTLRTATAAGLSGVVLPRAGVPEVGPLVIKASAGVAYRASILRAPTVVDALTLLAEAGFMLFGLAGEQGEPYFGVEIPERAAFVLGGETYGVSPEASEWVHQWLHIPMAGGVESLNVATASAALAFELVRRAHG